MNEDLSIPTHPLSPATFFAGEGGAFGDGNDIQPYNNYLRQQTTLTRNGDTPQPSVTIPPRYTGEREYYANYLRSGREAVTPQPPASEAADDVRAAAGELYVRTSRAGSIVRVYTPDGVLHRQHTILAPGLTKFPLAEGVYIVTLNNGAGRKVVGF
ncbi:MAG: hypothetical protein LBG96_16020 [Tannerella sp.]|nr:hypothetical protein [Tannerella sp.]